VNDFPVFFVTLSSNVFLELFDPRFTFFPNNMSAMQCSQEHRHHILGRIEHIAEQNASACLVNTNRQRFSLRLWFDNLSLLINAVRLRSRLVCPSEFPHQRISTVIVKVDTGNIRVVKGACAPSAFLVVATPGTIKSPTGTPGLGSATAMSREGRPLVVALVFLSLESL
jgi:hypothetical protein